VPINEINSLAINGDLGNDVVEFGSTLPFNPAFTGGGGTDRLLINVANPTFTSDLQTSGVEDLTAGGTANVTFTVPQHLGVLTLNDTARVAMATAPGQLLDITSLALAATATLDLGDGDLIVHSANSTARQQMLNLITTRIRASRESSPRWSGPGITSSLAAGNVNIGIAAIPNNVGAGGAALYTTFDGQAVNVNSVLVKTTYNGDRNLDGEIDADDYAGIDVGYAQGLLGYYNGDFDYGGGKPDADDYFLIDRAYSGQGAPLAGTQVAAAPEAASSAAAPATVEEMVAPIAAQTTAVEKPAARAIAPMKAKHHKRTAVKGPAVEVEATHKAKKKWIRRGFDF